MKTPLENVNQQKSAPESGDFGQSELSQGPSQFKDNRPEAIAQRKTQEAANSSPQVQQLKEVQAGANAAPVQRQELVCEPDEYGETDLTQDPFTMDLLPDEWLLVRGYIMAGNADGEVMTADADHNADIVTNAIFYHRYIVNGYKLHPEDPEPTQCLIPEVVLRDPRVPLLKPKVLAHGQIMDWTKVSSDDRRVYIMEQLVDDYNFPVNGAAGLVGNLAAESGTLPSRLEGSREATPLTTKGFDNTSQEFTPEQVQDRNFADKEGPKLPGVGLAQWTSTSRREGLFAHEYDGVVLGADILFSMDAQIDYLVSELSGSYSGVHGVITAADVSVNTACDDVVYRFEVPGSMLTDDTPRKKRPRTDPQVQAVFAERRRLANAALASYRAVHPVVPTTTP